MRERMHRRRIREIVRRHIHRLDGGDRPRRRVRNPLLQSRQLIRPLLPNLELYVLDTACYHPALGLILDNLAPDDFLL